LYTSLEKSTAIEELRRSAVRSNRALRDLGPRAHVEVQVRLTRVLDLTGASFCEALRVTKFELLENTSLCLEIADEARRLRCEGILVPSATGAGTNLVIYQDLLQPGWEIREVRRENNIPLD
jgi:RES domain-containing protein